MEFVIAGSGYSDTKCTQPTGRQHFEHALLAKIRAGHENANRRLKKFAILRHKFIHRLDGHEDYFYAVLYITELQFDDNPLFHAWP